jgi:predicted nucleic acid-binding protein
MTFVRCQPEIPAGAGSAPTSAPGEPPCIVLDSNVVLDWLYFRDRRCTALADAVATRSVRWIASAAMRDEIEHLLERGSLGTRWPEGPASLREGWRRWATMVEAAPAAASLAMRCSDADDQKFIDLALAARAVALLSADRAVLRLARRAGAWGLAIATVSAWRLAPSVRLTAAP